MITDSKIISQIEAANQFIDRNYLSDLTEYEVLELDDLLKKNDFTELYHIEKVVYDKNEDINDKLISVFHSITPFCKNVVMIVKGSRDCTDLYLGVRAKQRKDVRIASTVLRDSFNGNFPGSNIKLENNNNVFPNNPQNVAYVNILPSQRGSGEFVQGLEKFIDTMRGSEYICEIIASPVSDTEVQNRMNGFEELHSALFPFSKKTSSHGHNQGQTLTEGITESISDSISTGISRATGMNTSHNRGKNSGINLGMFMLLNFGYTTGTQEGWQEGTNVTDTENTSRGKTTSSARNIGTSQTTGTTDNLTIEFRNKSIENLLEKLDKHIKRMKAGSSYGVWEVATYFMSEKKTTAAIAASTYRSILLGEETGIEKSNFTLFDCADSKTLVIQESLTFCEHPVFRIPMFESGADSVRISPSSYINGKELALLMNFPRKSVNGVMVTEMAEFGRNVLSSDKPSRLIEMGHVFHMGQEQKETPVTLNIDSLTSHCFITGSTGSGKSNTVYKLIDEVSRYGIPFLVVEPAKGEYRNEFRKIPDINLFSTNPYIDQTLKLNPFAFCQGIHVLEHLDRIVEIFNGCWEMYAAMPAILKEAIEKAYESKGWDLLNSVFTASGEPVFPTFIDVLHELPQIINSSEYSAETKGDYIGALVTRVNSMTNGIYGQIFCDEFEVDNETLFDENTVIDLSRVGSSETKALIMGIVVLKLTEYRMTKAQHGNTELRHLTILEEAHNILKNSKNSPSTTGNNNVVAKSVEMIVNSIAEMRTYGEGFIIVDQSPTSVDIAAIKNTNTKIIMRLPEREDGDIAGHSVSLSEQQIDELAKLEMGVAVFMQNNWAEPVLTKVAKASNQYEGYEKPVTFEQLREFRSLALSILIEQFIKTDEYNIEKVIRKIEQFDISPAKIIEMRRMLKQFGNVMSKEFDSTLVGRTMLRLAACDSAFKRAEKYLKYETDPEGKEQYTDDSLIEWVQYINEALSQYILVDDSYKRSIKQYIIHSKKYEKQMVNYTTLYEQIY